VMGQPLLPRADKVRYAEVRADLLTYYEVRQTRDVAEAVGRLAHLDRFFEGRRISGIGPADVTEYGKLRQAEGAANGTINRELATLSKMLNVAFANNKLLRVPVIEKLDEAPARGGFVDDAEFNAISKHLSVDLQTVALVAYTFGWRKEEIFSRQLRHLDLDGGTLRLDPGETKNGAGRLVRLTPEVKTALAAQVTRVQTWMRSTGRIMP
jgi:integrase